MVTISINIFWKTLAVLHKKNVIFKPREIILKKLVKFK